MLLTLLLAASTAALPARPHLAVVVSVDGLGWATLTRYAPWFTHGLHRLLTEGRVESECRYQHLNTETGPGHSSLGTGAPPRVTGIVANRWFEQEHDGTMVLIPAASTRAGGRAPSGTLALAPGPGNLAVDTLADRLVAAEPRTRVVALAGKDRAAIMMAGRARSHAVYWYDADTGRFSTSSAYEPPARVRDLMADSNAHARFPAQFGQRWERLPLAEDQPAVPDSARPFPPLELFDYQIGVNGMGFPHDYRLNPGGYFTALYTSPAVDEMVADLAVKLLEDPELALGRGPQTDLLLLSFSAQDVVSHKYGIESEEDLDVLRRLDVQLERVLTAVEHAAPGATLLALSSDHGFAPIPEAARLRNPGYKGARLVNLPRTWPNVADRLSRLLSDELCLASGTRPVFGVEGWNLAYDHALLPLHTARAGCGPVGSEVGVAQLDEALARIAPRYFSEEILEVLPVASAARWPEDEAARFARNDLYPGRSGDAFLVPRPNVQMSEDPGRGSGHGTHYEYDTHVPLLFWGAGVAASNSSTPTTPYDLAPTLGARVGIVLPDAIGHDLLAVTPN